MIIVQKLTCNISIGNQKKFLMIFISPTAFRDVCNLMKNTFKPSRFS